MKRFALTVCAGLCVILSTSKAQAFWGSLCYSGYQPCWNIFAPRYRYMTPKEKRLQHFWHDYYHAMHCYYGALDHLDWVSYYKNHGYQINGGCMGPGGCGRINYAPVVVTPGMQWATPNSGMNGPPTGRRAAAASRWAAAAATNSFHGPQSPIGTFQGQASG